MENYSTDEFNETGMEDNLPDSNVVEESDDSSTALPQTSKTLASYHRLKFSFEDQNFVSKNTIFKLFASIDCKRCDTSCLQELSPKHLRDNFDFSHSIDLIHDLRYKFVNLSKKERAAFLMDLLGKDATYDSKTGKRMSSMYNLRYNRHDILQTREVCAVCFDAVYGISKHQRKRLFKKIKKNDDLCPPFNDTSNVTNATVADMKKTMTKNDWNPTREEIASIQLSRTPEVQRVSNENRLF